MDTDNVEKLALKLSIPMIISMLSIAIYNLVDTAFASNLGNDALLGISLAFPIQIIISAIGLGIGIGVNSFIGRTLGAKENEKIKFIISNGIIIGFIASIMLAILSNNCILKKFFCHFTNNESAIKFGIDYIKIIALFSICNVFQNLFSKILEAYGKAKISMFSQILAIVVNLVLDPILIFGINGNFILGIKGAAIATVIGRAIGMLTSLFFIIKLKDIDMPKFNNYKIKKECIVEIVKVAIPTILTESVAPITTIILNDILKSFSENAVTFYSIYYKVQGVIFMVVSGLNYGMIPIVSYNIGAKNKKRTNKAIGIFIVSSIIVTTVGTLAFLFFPKLLLGIFNPNDEIIEMGITGFRIFSIGFIFAGISFIMTGLFNAMGKSNSNLIIFLIRKVIIPFGFIILFKNVMGITSIWLAFTVAELIAFCVAIIFFIIKYKRIEFNS